MTMTLHCFLSFRNLILILRVSNQSESYLPVTQKFASTFSDPTRHDVHQIH